MAHSCLEGPPPTSTSQGGRTPHPWSCLLPWHHLSSALPDFAGLKSCWDNWSQTDGRQHQASFLLGLTLHPQHPTPVHRRCSALLGWADTQHPFHSWQCHLRHRAVVKQALGSSVATEISSSYLTLLGTPLYLVLDWFCIRHWDQKGEMRSLLLSAGPAHGTYPGCASPAAQSTQSCSCSVPSEHLVQGQGEEWGTTDTVHTGGGAGKMQSSQGRTCKSQAQSLKDTSLDQNPLDPDLKDQGPLSCNTALI